MKLNFAEWLQMQEAATTSGDVGVFSRIAIPLVRRANLGHWGEQDPFFSKKKKKKKNEVDLASSDTLY